MKTHQGSQIKARQTQTETVGGGTAEKFALFAQDFIKHFIDKA